MNQALIVYYSWSDTTHRVAEMIQKLTGAGALRLIPMHAYPTDYMACVEQSKRELAEKAAPELLPFTQDITKYDRVFLGSPIWCGSFAPPVRTFLSRYDLSGKIIHPFCTHGGGGQRNFTRDLKELCSQSDLKETLVLYGSVARAMEEAVEEWLQRTMKS